MNFYAFISTLHKKRSAILKLFQFSYTRVLYFLYNRMIQSKIKRLGMNLKSVAYIRDVLLIRKLAFWVCLKTRRATKRDALELATLR